ERFQEKARCHPASHAGFDDLLRAEMTSEAPDGADERRLAIAPAGEHPASQPQTFLVFELRDRLLPEAVKIRARGARPGGADEVVQTRLPVIVDRVGTGRPRHDPPAPG